ncbi:MAG: hypothetical protein GY757_48955 [bacterium]|nr:hypothetical protein [bacterium]
MKIDNSVHVAHRNLSNTSVRFLEFVKKNPGVLKRTNFSVLEQKLQMGVLQSWPTFINKYTRRQLTDAGIKVFDLIKSIPKRIFSDDPQEMSQYYRLPIDVIKTQMSLTDDKHIANIMGRGDFTMTTSGIKCLEYNVSGNIGGMQIAYWEPMYAEIPLIAKFIRENRCKIANISLFDRLMEHIFHNCREKFSTEKKEINVAVVIPEYGQGVEHREENKYVNQAYKRVLDGIGGGIKGRVIFCDFNHFNTRDKCLYYKGKRIHAVMEMYFGVITPEVSNAFKAGKICLFNGPVSKLISNKLNLALLSEKQDSQLFTPEERDAIKTYIPWTRRCATGAVTYAGEKMKLEELVFSHKEHLVLKPGMGYGGVDIFIGKSTGDEVWQKALKQAFEEGDWIIQEFVESKTYMYQKGKEGCEPHLAVWGIYVFGSRFGGLWVRTLPEANKYNVINSAQGAEESVVLEIEE